MGSGNKNYKSMQRKSRQWQKIIKVKEDKTKKEKPNKEDVDNLIALFGKKQVYNLLQQPR